MDEPGLDPGAHDRALRGLARINHVSRTATSLWAPIAAIARAHPGRPLALLDIATGGGALPIALARRASRHGLAIHIAGCDVSQDAVSHARHAAARANVRVRFFRADALDDALPGDYDIITASLFLHHLTNARVITLLRKLTASADHVLVSDLIRNRTGYWLAYAGTRLLSRSRIVHVDGMRSVRAALTISEARALAAEAGLAGAHFARRWPSRFLLTWHRDELAAA